VGKVDALPRPPRRTNRTIGGPGRQREKCNTSTQVKKKMGPPFELDKDKVRRGSTSGKPASMPSRRQRAGSVEMGKPYKPWLNKEQINGSFEEDGFREKGTPGPL